MKVATYLCGKHKPFWHPETDCGDHVVVVNTSRVAMHGFDWKHLYYYFSKVGGLIRIATVPDDAQSRRALHDLGLPQVEERPDGVRNS